MEMQWPLKEVLSNIVEAQVEVSKVFGCLI